MSRDCCDRRGSYQAELAISAVNAAQRRLSISPRPSFSRQVDEEWMAHFHAGIVVPAPCSPDVNGRHPRRDGTVAAGGQDDHDFSDQQQDPRWRFCGTDGSMYIPVSLTC